MRKIDSRAATQRETEREAKLPSTMASNPATLSSIWQVNTRVHKETGYWGPVDANHQFCEPHYATTEYLAEAWNAVSSLLFVAAAWWAFRHPDMKQLRRHEQQWIKCACLWLAVIGVGSFLFHATMRRSMQWMDEGPMIGFLGTSILWKIDKHRWVSHQTDACRLVLGALHVALLWVYLWLDWYELFVHGFTFLGAIDACFSYTWSRGQPVYRDLSALCIIFGRLVWEIENRFCEHLPDVWPLHVIWHLASSFSAYFAIRYNMSIVDQVKKA